MYTREKSLASSFETARSAHVPLKILHKRKIISMFSGTVQGTDRSARVPLKSLHKRKILTHYFYVQ